MTTDAKTMRPAKFHPSAGGLRMLEGNLDASSLTAPTAKDRREDSVCRWAGRWLLKRDANEREKTPLTKKGNSRARCENFNEFEALPRNVLDTASFHKRVVRRRLYTLENAQIRPAAGEAQQKLGIRNSDRYARTNAKCPCAATAVGGSKNWSCELIRECQRDRAARAWSKSTA